MSMDHMQPKAAGLRTLAPGRALLLPAGFAAALAVLGLVLWQSTTVSFSMLAGAGVLFVWTAALFFRARSTSRALYLEVMLFKHHWVQACTQIAIYSYWGWHAPEIRVFAPLLLAQILFAYGFHTLLTWSRRDHYGLGFGPLPICLSFNLFILFRPDWFYWQFGIVALAFLAKEFIRWEKDGRWTHIFNPSSFALVVFSVVLILTGTTNATLGVEIASLLEQLPHIHWVLFLVSLPVQLLFGIATMTFAAGVTTYLLGLAYFGLTGTYFYFDAYIPVAVFIGMLLLITDPATSPRTESGRVLFGVMYGVGIMAAFGLLRVFDLPAFYDKLLPVPFLNLSVRAIDRFIESGRVKALDLTAVAGSLRSAQRRLAFAGLWVVAFLSMAAANGVGDEHPGQWVPFWQETCAEGSDRACEHLAVLSQGLCFEGSGWACNELGILAQQLSFGPNEVTGPLNRGCSLGFDEACANLQRLQDSEGSLEHAPPLPPDLPIVLRGNQRPIAERDTGDLYALACERGFPGTCVEF